MKQNTFLEMRFSIACKSQPELVNLNALGREKKVITLLKSEELINSRIESFEQKKLTRKHKEHSERPNKEHNLEETILAQLNKISDTNFEMLAQRLLEELSAEKELIDYTLTILLKKASNSKLYGNTYAQLALYFAIDDIVKNSLPKTPINVRKTIWCELITAKLEMEFKDFLLKKGYCEDSETNIKLDIFYEGTAKFIAHLANNHFISNDRLCTFIEQLLETDNNNRYNEQNIEAVCGLLEILEQKHINNVEKLIDITGLLKSVTKENSSTRARILVLNLLNSLDNSPHQPQETKTKESSQEHNPLIEILCELGDLDMNELAESIATEAINKQLDVVETEKFIIFALEKGSRFYDLADRLLNYLTQTGTAKTIIEKAIESLMNQTCELEIDFPNIRKDLEHLARHIK